MDQKKLNNQINAWIENLDNNNRESLIARLSGLKSIYPFNEFEYRLIYLQNKKVISFNEYESLRNAYVNSNPFLHLYNISPRVFGEIWAQQHLIDIDHRFKKPSKEKDKKYSGDYDLYIEIEKRVIKIEVKASRAINTKIRGGLETKALSFKSKEPYWMNFQQLKTGIPDIFVFIGVWVDKIQYWVLSKDEVKNHPTISHQHRGGIEFQIGITEKNISKFNKFLVSPNNIINHITTKIKK